VRGPEIIALLRQHGADPMAADSDGRTPEAWRRTRTS
jgi:hypothetical protein